MILDGLLPVFCFDLIDICAGCLCFLGVALDMDMCVIARS